MKRSGKNNYNYKTGLAMEVNGKRCSLYNSWNNMKQRCKNINNPKYKRYGGRGIKIDNSWETIEGFSEWAFSSGWQEGLTIDRIDNNGNYEPNNCKWITVSENSRKKRTTKITREQAEQIRIRAKNGESEHDLAKEYGVVHGTVWFIVKGFTHVAEGECTKKLNDRPQPK